MTFFFVMKYPELRTVNGTKRNKNLHSILENFFAHINFEVFEINWREFGDWQVLKDENDGAGDI